MLPKFNITQLLWFVLLIFVFIVLGNGYAEAEEGVASWYGPGFEGRPTASGVPYDPNGFTAASKTLPLGTNLVVSYGERTVSVTVNDRGPFVAGRDLDLSQGAAQALGLTGAGVDKVGWRLADSNLPQGASLQPNPSQGAAHQPDLSQGAASQQPNLSQGAVQDKASSDGSYLVQPGDTLSDIASRFGTSVDHLTNSNSIADPNLIHSGQVLHLQPGIGSQELGPPQRMVQQSNSPQEAAPTIGLRKVGVGYVEDWRLLEPNVPQGASLQPNLSQGVPQQPNLSQEAARQLNLSQGTSQQPNLSQGVVQDKANSDGNYLVQPGDILSDIASRFGTSVDHLANSNNIADPNFIHSGQVLHLQPSVADPKQASIIDPTFIRGQEGFRLDGYVPDPGFSRSGTTVGTGVDIGQMSVADIEALDVPLELKQKLEPYAGRIGQDALNFLNNHPLHLTQDEAHTLDQIAAQNTIENVANRFNTAAPGNVFAGLPLEARTAITDVAYQYGPNLAQRMPSFWSDVTKGRWNNVIQELRNFGDRYPTRRSAEADLLQRAVERGDLSPYVQTSP